MIKKHTQLAGLALAAACAAVLAPTANALVLRYEEAGFGHNVGDLFDKGPVTLKIQDWDAGTTYTTAGGGQLPVGTTRGFGQDGTGVQTNLGGVTELNAPAGVTVTQAAQSRPLGLLGAGAARNDDTWGIAKITDIRDSNGLTIWSSIGKSAELTALFYGEQDTYFKQTAADTLTSSGVGLRIDLWEQGLPTPAGQTFNPSLGPGGRDAGGLGYTTVTEGTKILTLQSAPGFLHLDGTLGGSAAEFETRFNVAGGKGSGDAYMNVIGGTEAARFDTNQVSSNVSAPGLFSDIAISFTNDSRTLAQGNSTNKFDWLVTSDDPIKGNVIPEPTSALVGLGCTLAMFAGRRRKVATVA